MPTIELPCLRVETVAAVVEGTRPVLVNRDPGPAEEAVPIDATITLHLVDTGVAGIDRAATSVWVNDVLAFDGEVQAGFDGPATVVSQDADTLYLCLDPVQVFASEAVVSVRVVTATNDGHALDVQYVFTVEDRTAPRVTSAQATSPTTLRVGFDEAVVALAGATYSFMAMGAPAVDLRATTAHADGSVLSVSVAPEMTPDVRYRLLVEGVTDTSGNAVMAPTNEVVFNGFRPARPADRRFDLWEMLPAFNRRSDLTGDLKRFIDSLQEVTDLLLADIDRFPDIFDLERAPAPFVDLILRDLGNPFPFDLDVLGKRRLASVLVAMYRQKGTAVGIKNAVRFFLGVEVLAIHAYAGEVMTLSEAELGVDWVLGPSSRFARYAFDVEVGAHLTDVVRGQLRAIVEYLKPAHTHFVTLVEPAEPAFVDHWTLGVSEIGVSADLH